VPGENCSRCSARRIGAFRFCLRCGFDYDAAPIAAAGKTQTVAASEFEPQPVGVREIAVAAMSAQPVASSTASQVTTIATAERRAHIRARLKQAEEPEGRVEAVTHEHIRPIEEPDQPHAWHVGTPPEPAVPVAESTPAPAALVVELPPEPATSDVDRPVQSTPSDPAAAPVVEPSLLVVSEPRPVGLPAIPSLADRNDRFVAAGVAVILGLAAVVGLLRGPMPQIDSSKGLFASEAVAAATPIAPAGASGSAPAIAASSTGPTLPATGSGAAESAAPGDGPTGPTQRGVVARIIDGVTVEVMIDQKVAVVRYLSITVPGSEADALSAVAVDANRALVDRQMVILERDVSDTDAEGRLLRHVWRQDASGRYSLISIELVREGLALVETSLPDVKYAEELDAAQAAAKADRVGLWAP
jgi:endonuclease YncB( thermonuclease family)